MSKTMELIEYELIRELYAHSRGTPNFEGSVFEWAKLKGYPLKKVNCLLKKLQSEGIASITTTDCGNVVQLTSKGLKGYA